MGNRILKESICSSDNLDNLSWFEEVFFYRLIVNCDDFGRTDARIPILKARLFPLKSVTEDTMIRALDALSAAKLIKIYKVDERIYLELSTWSKHQQIRCKKSKYPNPEDGIIVPRFSTDVEKSTDRNCNHLKSDEIKCCSNPIQSNTNPIQNKTVLLSKEEVLTEGMKSCFDAFWTKYPKKCHISEAKAAFCRLVELGIDADEIVTAACKYTLEKASTDTRYCKKPEDFLTVDFIMPYLPKFSAHCQLCNGNGIVFDGDTAYECQCANRYKDLTGG